MLFHCPQNELQGWVANYGDKWDEQWKPVAFLLLEPILLYKIELGAESLQG